MDETQRIAWAAQLGGLVAQAKADLATQQLKPEALDAILQHALGATTGIRQRLLYLHAALPSIYAPLIAAAAHEPVAGATTQIDPLAPELPYQSVHDAVVDGWRIVHFPDQRAPFEDREIDILGYEFILEKLEHYDE
jgi:hypothetical protein